MDPNSGLHAKTQREISRNIVRRLHWPLGGEQLGKGGMVYGEGESRIEIWTKVFEKLSEKCGKIIGEELFSRIFVLDSKTIFQFRSPCKISREKSLKSQKVLPPIPFVWKCGHSPLKLIIQILKLIIVEFNSKHSYIVDIV